MAQNSNKSINYISVGLTVPYSPQTFKDYWKTGFNLGVGFGKRINQTISGLLSLEFNNLYFDRNGFLRSFDFNDSDISISAGSTQIISIMSNLKNKLTSKDEDVIPYLIGGIGFLRFSQGKIRVSDPYQSVEIKRDPEVSLSASLGFGFDFELTQNSFFFIQLNYSIGFTEDKNTIYIPIRLGISSK